MQYKTNQLDSYNLFSIENYRNIAQDFWVYKFTIDTSKVGYQYSLIDELKQNLPKIKSVVYLKGKVFYALFKKNDFKDEFQLEDKIGSLIKDSDEVLFDRIQNLRDLQVVGCKDEYQQAMQSKRYLAQLLLNSLANTSSENTKCSNITGGLYWISKTVEGKQKENMQAITWQYVTIKIELDYHLHLKLDVKTFSNLKMTGKMNFVNRKIQFKDYVQYEILSDNIRSMRRLENKEYNTKPETTYILAQADGKKSSVSFLDFYDWEGFESSKSGILYLFLKEINEHLNQYLNLKFKELPFSQEKTLLDHALSKEIKSRIKEFYQGKPVFINIAETLKNDQESNELARKLQTFLTDPEREYKIENVTIGELQENALNFRIIRNKNYYKDNGLKDEYYRDKKYLIHHITIDDFDIELTKVVHKKNDKGEKVQKEKTLLVSPAIDVILKESYIKNDIKQGKITIMDWRFGEWIFMEKVESENDTESEESKEKKYDFHVLRVLGDGGLEYTICKHDQIFSNQSYERYKTIYQYNDKYNGREFLNCLLVSNNQDINLIYETPRFTIQEIEKIGETLELEAQEIDLTKNQILRLFDKFIADNQSFANDDKLKATLQRINTFREKFSKKELNSLFDEQGLTNRKNIKKAFCDFYYKNSEQYLGQKDVLHHFFKRKGDIEELFSSNIKMKTQVKPIIL